MEKSESKIVLENLQRENDMLVGKIQQQLDDILAEIKQTNSILRGEK